MNRRLAVTLAGLALASQAGAQQATALASGPDTLKAPVRLQAGGELIDVGECFAHAGPRLEDLDGDGKQDLLVGDFAGHIHFFRNTASNQAPVYAAGKPLEVNAKIITIPNW